TADNPQNLPPYLFDILQGRNQIRTDVFLQAASTDREDQDGVFFAHSAATKPLHKNGGPAIVIGPGGQLRDVVSRSISFEAGQFAKIVDGMRGIRRAASDSQDKQPTALGTRLF